MLRRGHFEKVSKKKRMGSRNGKVALLELINSCDVQAAENCHEQKPHGPLILRFCIYYIVFHPLR